MDFVNTKNITDRRKLQFNTIDDLLADIDRIVAAEKSGKLRKTGNWTAGQAFGHLAAWMSYSYEGYPFKPPPWFIRFILGFKRKKYLRDGMDPGVRIPGLKDGTLATDLIPTEEGAQRLKKVLARFKAGEPAKFQSPAFGPMTQDDRLRFNLRHAELHLSFLHLS